MRDELIEMSRADQEARSGIGALFSAGEPDSAALSHMAMKIDSVDTAHLNRLRLLIEEHGWPTIELVGREGAEAAFLIVQHADDIAFQRRYLEHLERAYPRGEADGESLALLTDRLRVAEGRPQLYGTQAALVNGRLEVEPIEDEANVDARRAALGLPPLEVYLEQLRAMYGGIRP